MLTIVNQTLWKCKFTTLILSSRKERVLWFLKIMCISLKIYQKTHPFIWFLQFVDRQERLFECESCKLKTLLLCLKFLYSSRLNCLNGWHSFTWNSLGVVFNGLQAIKARCMHSYRSVCKSCLVWFRGVLSIDSLKGSRVGRKQLNYSVLGGSGAKFIENCIRFTSRNIFSIFFLKNWFLDLQ